MPVYEALIWLVDVQVMVLFIAGILFFLVANASAHTNQETQWPS